MKTRKLMALVLSIVMVFSICSTAFAAHLTDEVTELEARNSDISVEMAKQSYILFENNGVLPLQDEEKAVALFGNATDYTVKGGTGSGDVNQRSRDHIDEAFVAAGWELVNTQWLAKMAEQQVSSGGCGGGVKDDIEITAEDLAEATAKTDLAVYSICRNAGEGSDREADKGDYFLDDIERANIELLAANFDRFVIVFNTCVIDTGWVSEIDGIDAILYMSNGGQRGAEALVAVLEGEVTPSGKLTDTWPISYTDYPSNEGFSSNDGNTATEYYTEGIYNGYRYFDTFGLDVSYEFGYGLSYTEFDIEVVDVAVSGDSIDVTVDVINVGGEFSGKEVVQVYFSAPDGELEKPYQELAAFGKTAELAPGEKQEITVSFATQDMSSYSEAKAAYIMEAGDYIIRVGNSSRNTQVAAVATLAETTIVEQLSNQVVPEIDLEELSKEGATPITYPGEAAEIAAAPRYAIENLPFANNASEYDAETAYTYLFAEDYENYEPQAEVTIRGKTVKGILQNNTGNGGYDEVTYAEEKVLVDALPEGITKETAKLTDVYDGKITLRQFVACLTIDEMARLCVGGAGTIVEAPDGTQIGAAASSVQGGAGQTTQALFQTRHVPSMPNADGPAGIRITQHYTQNGVDYYQFCTAFPAGTCYAGSWNTDLYTQMGDVIGSEMIEYGVTHWLAPALNIHRNALCGRNFEYYSEDPLLSGIVAGYVTAGVQAYEGIGVTLKHYWGNSQENNRNAANNVISERAAREIYLKGFETAVKLAQPMCIMTCYNVNNGVPGADDHDSNYDLTRGEWGFKGFIMTDWGGGQATGFIEMHAGNDMVMPGGDPSVILKGTYDQEAVWGKDGFVNITVDNRGRQTLHWNEFTPDADGDVKYEVPVEGGFEAINSRVWDYVDAGSAMVHANEDGSYSVIWTGSYPGNIVKGDLQKAAYNVLNVALQSQDMAKMYAAEPFNREISVGSYSENNGALLTQGWAQSEAGKIENVAIVADTVNAECGEGQTAAVEVSYEGEPAITTARFKISSEIEIADIVVADGYEMENNNGYVVIYAADGSEIDGVLCTINYDLDVNPWIANGTYAIGIDVVDASDMNEENITLAGVDGALVINNDYYAGDVNLDGIVSNCDVIEVARYLVDLTKFTAAQIEQADLDGNDIVNNIDLIKLARGILAGGRIDEATGTYTVVVEGFDWGAASTKIILDLDRVIDAESVEASDFRVRNTMQGCRGSSTSTRKVTAAYVSDAEGNAVEGDSSYVAIDMYVSPNDGGAFYYDMMNGGLNKWPDPYYFTIEFASEDCIKYSGTLIDNLILPQEPIIVCPLADQFEQTEFKSKDGKVLNYGSWAPAEDNGKNPLIIWLHGAGEGGTDNDIVAMGNKVVNLITPEIQQYFKTDDLSGAYVLTPQSPTMWMDMGDGQYTNNGANIYTAALMELIESYVKANPDIDADRIYIGGCSNGGYMTMNMIMTYPDYFAAAYPICEAYTDTWITNEQIAAIADMPIWFTHAANDTTVNPETHTLVTYARIVAAGNDNVHLSYFDDVRDTSGQYFQNNGQPYQYQGHWSWVYTLNNECVEKDGTTIMEWLAAQSK